MNQTIRRGDLYYANLDPVIGSEQGGMRPVLIIQNNAGNQYSPTTIIAAAITSKKEKKPLPTHVPLHNNTGLERHSLLLLEQIRTIDRCRLCGYIGSLNTKGMEAVNQALAVSLGLQQPHPRRNEGK